MIAKVSISVFVFLAVFFIPDAYVISQTLPPISKLGASRKSIIHKSLLDLHDSYLSKGLSKSRMLTKRVGIKSVGEKVRVDIDFYGEKPSIEYLAKSGIEKDDSFYEYGSHIQMAVPIRNIRLLENLPNVASVRLPPKGHPDIVSQGVKVIGASEYHEKGYSGKGVKIAVIDGGFSGYSALLGYELPNTVITKSFYGSVSGYGDITGEGTDHGTACAEIIYDIAPEATLYLINVETLAELHPAVAYAISRNVDIISLSLCWLNTSNYDGTGNVCSLVDEARQNDILWVNSVGNYANKHYEGYFFDPDDDRWHNFSEEGEVIEIKADTGDMIVIYLSWNAWPRTSKDYDLCLWKKNYSGEFEKLEWSENRQTGYQEPTESIHYEATYTGTYYVTVWKKADSGNAKIEIFSSTHEFTRYSVPESSIPDPACSENAVAVGATWWYNDSLEDFSSRGPTNDARIKPDLVAPNSVSTFTYSSFWGTSASCPHVAGAAALTLELNPTWNPAEIENFLFANAKDLGSWRKDNLYGWGRISLPEPPSEPNLRPYKPAEWDYELVPSSVKGTNTVDQLIGDEVTYFDLAIANNEADIDSTQIIEVYIYIGGSLVKKLSTKGFQAGWYVYWTDLPIKVTPGTHVVRFEVDPLNKINESNEGDNIWERSFTWIKMWREYIFQTTDHTVKIKIDETWHDSPETFKWKDDTDHRIEVLSVQNISADSRYKFTHWSGKSTSIDMVISIHANPEAAGIYQANYKAQYILNVSTDPAGLVSHVSVPDPDDPPNWYDKGRELSLVAPETVDTWIFRYWEVDGDRIEADSITVKMDSTHEITGFYRLNYQPIADAGNDTTVMAGQTVTLDGSGSSDPDGDVLSYQWALEASNPAEVVLSDASAVNPTFTPSVPGTYDFVLVVNDGTSDSVPDTVGVTVMNRTPVAPKGLVAVAYVDLVRLVWFANTESDLYAYYIYRDTSSPATTLLDSVVAQSSPDTFYVDTDVEAGTTYYYRITAVDSWGGESGYSNEVSATVEDVPPATPKGLAAVAYVDSVRLSWNANTDLDLYAYYIYRDTLWPSATLLDSVVASGPPVYVDRNVVNGTTYYYRVTAVDRAGNESGGYMRAVTPVAPYFPGDFNRDGQVSLNDFSLFVQKYGLSEGDDAFDSLYDLDGDGKIGLGDFSIFVQNYGKRIGSAKAIPVTVGENREASLSLNMVDRLKEASGDMKLVVRLDGVRALKGYSFKVRYDESRFDFRRAKRVGEGFPDNGNNRWPLLVVSPTVWEVIIADVVRGDEVIEDGGVLVELCFKCKGSPENAKFTTIEGIFMDTEGEMHALESAEVVLLPQEFVLLQNFPNPFNASTAIGYQLPEASEIRLSVYNLLGQEVRRLVEGEVEAGTHVVLWDGRDENGTPVGSGIYFYRLKAGEVVRTRKALLLR